MKLFYLLVYGVIARVLDFLNRYFDVPKLRYLREVVDVSVGILRASYRQTNGGRNMAKRMTRRAYQQQLQEQLYQQQNYTFRPYELVEIDYRRSALTLLGSSSSSASGSGSGSGSSDSINSPRKFPKPRSGHRIVCNDSAVFCFGGFNPNLAVINDDHETSSCLFQELWRFDIARKEWTLLQDANHDLPQELASNAMLLYGNCIMIFGGTGFPFGVNCSNKLYMCQPKLCPKQMIEIEAKGEHPPPLYGQGIMCSDNYLYTIGGTDGFDYTCDVHRLHLPTKTWECMYTCRHDIREDPPGRYRHELAYDDNTIYVLGGGTSDSAFSLAAIPAYDLRKNQWRTYYTKADTDLPIPSYPAARKCHSCVQIRTDAGLEVIVAGGYNQSTHFRDIWKLNVRTHQWRMMQNTNLPHPLFFHDAAITSEGCMYIFGGIKINNNTNVRTDTVFRMWTTIPKLSAIAWDALLQCFPKLQLRTREELLEVGIPLQFAERITDG